MSEIPFVKRSLPTALIEAEAANDVPNTDRILERSAQLSLQFSLGTMTDKQVCTFDKTCTMNTIVKLPFVASMMD
jgi:hypothetical protein